MFTCWYIHLGIEGHLTHSSIKVWLLTQSFLIQLEVAKKLSTRIFNRKNLKNPHCTNCIKVKMKKSVLTFLLFLFTFYSTCKSMPIEESFVMKGNGNFHDEPILDHNHPKDDIEILAVHSSHQKKGFISSLSVFSPQVRT